MGILSAIFGGDEVTATTSTSVTVNPETNIVNVLDLEPIQKLINGLSGVQLESAKVTAAGLTALAESTERIAAGDRAADSTDRNFMFAVLGGVGLLALAKR